MAEPTDDTLGSSRVWIFGGHSSSSAQVARGDPKAASTRRGAAARCSTSVTADTDSTPCRSSSDGQRVGTLVAGLTLAPYEQTRRRAVATSIAFFIVLLAIVGSAVWWLLRAALRPVAQMTEQAAAWSEHDLDRRFGLGVPHDELTRLGATLDGLLDRLAASLRHERRFSAELSHELRTPLAQLMAEAEVALRRDRTTDEYRDSLAVVLANAQQVARIVDALVAAAQHSAQPQGVANAQEVAAAIVAAVRLSNLRGVELALDSPHGGCASASTAISPSGSCIPSSRTHCGTDEARSASQSSVRARQSSSRSMTTARGSGTPSGSRSSSPPFVAARGAQPHPARVSASPSPADSPARPRATSAQRAPARVAASS